MSEEKIYGAPETMETEVAETEVVETEVAETEVAENEVVEEQAPVQEVVNAEPVKAKKGFATAALVFGILAFITTLFLLNYVFGILALIFGIVYLAKKADVKPKKKAIAGIVLASLSLVISTVLWVSAYNYITKTSVTDIVDDVIGILGDEAISGKLEELTGGAINQDMLQQMGSGEEIMNNMVVNMTGGAMDLDTVEQFVGGEVSVDRIVNFVGDVKEEEITGFINEVENMDQETIQSMVEEFEGEVTYEKLEEKLGKDFSLKELMDYIRNFEKAN